MVGRNTPQLIGERSSSLTSSAVPCLNPIRRCASASADSQAPSTSTSARRRMANSRNTATAIIANISASGRRYIHTASSARLGGAKDGAAVAVSTAGAGISNVRGAIGASVAPDATSFDAKKSCGSGAHWGNRIEPIGSSRIASRPRCAISDRSAGVRPRASLRMPSVSAASASDFKARLARSEAVSITNSSPCAHGRSTAPARPALRC